MVPSCHHSYQNVRLRLASVCIEPNPEKTNSGSQKENRPSLTMPKSCCCRERGARALEERLATERMVPPKKQDELQSDALDSV